MLIPELLAPAGSPEALDAAVGEGADAVYLGLKNFNARMRSVNFTYSQFENALKTLHKRGKKIFVTVNTVFEEREADRMYQLLKYLAGLGPDGIVVQDFGVITMVRENFPSLKLLASTQMNITTARGVNLLSRYGFSRVVLARELSMEEIGEIRRNTNVELEVFIHGALCVSISGLCLFSSYLGGKSANRGMCAQACRRRYQPEAQRSPAVESTESGYYFSPNDLQLIEKIPDIARNGVNSLKIEGRMKSAEYVGTVVSAYRLVLDSLQSPESEQISAIKKAKEILLNDFARSKTTYLFCGGSDFDWLNPKQDGGTGIPLGKILKTKNQYALIGSGPVLPVSGDTIRLHSFDDTRRESHKVISTEDENMPSGSAAKGSRSAADSCFNRWVSIPEGFKTGDSVYLIQTKAMTRRYQKIIDKNIKAGVRGPGRDRAPPPKCFQFFINDKDAELHVTIKKPHNKQAAGNSKQRSIELKDGIYVQVSNIEDLYVLQSIRPEKAVVVFSKKIFTALTNKKQPLPFGPDEIILWLDPYIPQNKEDELAEIVSNLKNSGYKNFIVNNTGHFSFFRKASAEGINLIAGPWLYCFNSWALSFLKSNEAEYFVSPLENNRQNLERTVKKNPRAQSAGIADRRRVFLTVYSKPSLFRLRPDLEEHYRFRRFSGNENETFELKPSSEGTIVYPHNPFYIADKIPFLREAGFAKFILDFSSGSIKKTEYREMMKAVNEAAPPSGMSRFNWKDGFFRDKD